MADEARKLLDELMGRTRNLDPNDNPQNLRWDDPDVCKYYLCGFCPHELFTNTRADLGLCNKIHDDALRKEYQNSSRFERLGYEDDFIRFLQSLISDVEKRIRRGHQRLALNRQEASSIQGHPSQQNAEKIKLLTERINELVVQAEELGCEGKVEEAQGVMKLADQLTEERTALEKTPPIIDPDRDQMKQMEVCDVCGAFLIVGDAPQRQDEHLMGKQHAGYAQVREEIDRRKRKVREELEEREAKEEKIRKERQERQREREREKDEKRRKERDRDRDRDRDRRRRSRSRDRRRSRSRDRSRRDRSRDRHRDSDRHRDRDRDRQRDRDKDRDRRRRSSSREKHSSSRRRSRSRNRSKDRRDKSKEKDRDEKRKSKDKDEKSSSQGGDKNGDGEKDNSTIQNGTDSNQGEAPGEPAENGDQADGMKADTAEGQGAEDKGISVDCQGDTKIDE